MSNAQGWWWPSNSRMAHYFPAADNSRSLCGKWGRLFGKDSDLEDDQHGSPDNCKACQKARAKMEEKAKQNVKNPGS